MEIRRSSDCGNSPKNSFAEEVAIALLGGDREAAGRQLAPDAVMEAPSVFRVVGRVEILDRLRAADELEIDSVVTHGRVGAVAGTVTRGGRLMPFAMILRFATAKAAAVQVVRLYGANPDLVPPS